MSQWIRSALVLAIWVCATPPESVKAQISPGPLSQPHAQLESNDQCLQCHSQKKRVSRDLCLECHEILGERIENQQGYHATLGDQGCEKCHMEHHGREFELVWWGDEGQRAFNHEGTGYVLVGAHANLECRKCHTASLVADRDRLRKQKKDLERTFLGLAASTCSACHKDPHGGEFAPRRCEECHGAQTWKDTSGFRHQETRFPLLGQHHKVACDKCHARSTPAGTRDLALVAVQFSGLQFANCSDCHKDPHAGQLGIQCKRCHTEQSWQSVELEGFDHRRARFALEGAHQRIQCAECHRAGTAYRVARFQACTDCHQDPHVGQFAQRADGGICTACHDLEAFSPPNFTLEAHQKSEYPLEASHLAVPCDACHQRVSASEIAGLTGNQRLVSRSWDRQTIARFSFPSTACSECHLDPHEGAVDRFMGAASATSSEDGGRSTSTTKSPTTASKSVIRSPAVGSATRSRRR